MPPRINLTGCKFGRLTVKEFSYISNGGNAVWKCQCVCGKTLPVLAMHLKSSHTVSCGCYNKEVAGLINYKHGYKRMKCSSTYKSWQCMKTRCLKPYADNYKWYGGRGIKICTRWKNSFINFLADMGERPHGMTLDRKDNNGNYTPRNCKWSTPTEQFANQRQNW